MNSRRSIFIDFWGASTESCGRRTFEIHSCQIPRQFVSDFRCARRHCSNQNVAFLHTYRFHQFMSRDSHGKCNVVVAGTRIIAEQIKRTQNCNHRAASFINPAGHSKALRQTAKKIISSRPIAQLARGLESLLLATSTSLSRKSSPCPWNVHTLKRRFIVTWQVWSLKATYVAGGGPRRSLRCHLARSEAGADPTHR